MTHRLLRKLQVAAKIWKLILITTLQSLIHSFYAQKLICSNKLQINSSLIYIFKLLIVIKHKKHKKLRRNRRGTEVWRDMRNIIWTCAIWCGHAQYDADMRNIIQTCVIWCTHAQYDAQWLVLPLNFSDSLIGWNSYSL